MPAFKKGWKYLWYFLNAVDEHSLHSPFIYKIYTELIKPDQRNKRFDVIEDCRKKLKKDNRSIQIEDFGSGSHWTSSPIRKISRIARYSATAPKYSRLNYRLIEGYQSENIIELGASFGINTLYMAAGNPNAQVYTLEGCPETAKIARKNFDSLAAGNIDLRVGNIDHTLPPILNQIDRVDFVYIDANHSYEATRRYFEMLLPKLTHNSVMIFDDIHWSRGMEYAWQEIVAHRQTTLTIDLFQVGLVFFKPLYSKQHYIINY